MALESEQSNVFISWSGERSRIMAQSLRTWLPNVIQRVKPWVSTRDLWKGVLWDRELAVILEKINVGILCVTRENPKEPWLLFEAGSLAKIGKARVFPLLLDMEFDELSEPLQKFHSVKSEKDDIFQMLDSINNVVDGDRLSNEMLQEAFDMWWPKLDEQLKKIPPSDKEPPEPPSEKEMLRSIAAKMNMTLNWIADMGRQFQSTVPTDYASHHSSSPAPFDVFQEGGGVLSESHNPKGSMGPIKLKSGHTTILPSA